MSGGCGERAHDVRGAIARPRDVPHAPNQAQLTRVCALREHAVEAVLRQQLAHHGIASPSDAKDSPAGLTRSGRRVFGKDRLVRSVERANAKVDDAD